MTTLAGKYWVSEYTRALQIGSSNVGLSGSIQYVQDGLGNNTPLGLSTSAVKINASTITINGFTLGVTGTSTINGSVSGTLSGNLTVAAGKTLTCNNSITITGTDTNSYNLDSISGPDMTAWSAWTPTVTGFSGTPTVSGKYKQQGKIVFVSISVSGTSNATTFTCTNLPFTALKDFVVTVPKYTDNGAAGYLGLGTVSASSTTITFNTASGGAWTNPGTKGITNFDFIYEST